MDREDVADLLAIVAMTDKRTVGEPEIVLWHQLLGHYTRDDCLDAIMAHRRECPGQWLEPGHIVQRVKAVIKDRYERCDPNTRDQTLGPWAGVRRDRYGHIDKSAPDELECPVEWTSEQRIRAWWDQVNRRRDAAAGAEPDDPSVPAADATRRAAMAQIRTLLAKTPPGQERLSVEINALSVRCPWCHSAVGEPCMTPGRPRRPLRRSRAHPSRIEAAGVAGGMSKPAAEAAARGEQIAAIAKFRADNPRTPVPAEMAAAASETLGASSDPQ